MALLVSKRLSLLASLMVVDVLLGGMFLAMYMEVLHTTWDHSQAIYFVGITLVVLVISGGVFSLCQKELKEGVSKGQVVEGVLLKRQQFGRLNRKLIIWTYTYTIDKISFTRRYWHLVNVRDLEIGDRFYLLVNQEKPTKTYFYMKEGETESVDES